MPVPYLLNWLPVGPGVLLVVAAGAVLAGLLLLMLLLGLRRRSRRPILSNQEPAIDVTALKFAELPTTGPQLEYYGTPVRLAVLVLAPAGRGSEMPASLEMPRVVENLIPGLARIMDLHHPVFQCWPEQLSSQGFAQSFFSQVPLPGDRGKGTPWCAVAGRFDSGGQSLLAGIVCRAAAANGLGQIVIQHQGQWNDVLRVRSS